MAETRYDGNWIVKVDRFAGFNQGRIVVHIAERGNRLTRLYGPTMIEDVLEEPGSKTADLSEYAWHIPEGAVRALCAALLDQDPASERLTNKLEVLLDREASRVDKLIDKVASGS